MPPADRMLLADVAVPNLSKSQCTGAVLAAEAPDLDGVFCGSDHVTTVSAD